MGITRPSSVLVSLGFQAESFRLRVHLIPSQRTDFLFSHAGVVRHYEHRFEPILCSLTQASKLFSRQHTIALITLSLQADYLPAVLSFGIPPLRTMSPLCATLNMRFRQANSLLTVATDTGCLRREMVDLRQSRYCPTRAGVIAVSCFPAKYARSWPIAYKSSLFQDRLRAGMPASRLGLIHFK